MDQTTSQFFSVAQWHLEAFDSWCIRLGLQSLAEYERHGRQSHLQPQADHLCFKCGSHEEFDRVRALFEFDSAYIYQSIISDRRIALIKFLHPLPTVLGEISFLELSDQKPDGSQESGFHHVEIFPITGSSSELATKLEACGVSFKKETRPHHTTYDTVISSGLTVRLEDEPLLKKIKREEMR